MTPHVIFFYITKALFFLAPSSVGRLGRNASTATKISRIFGWEGIQRVAAISIFRDPVSTNLLF